MLPEQLDELGLKLDELLRQIFIFVIILRHFERRLAALRARARVSVGSVSSVRTEGAVRLVH